MGLAYYNGNYCEETDIKLSLTDRAIYFADGVYDAMIGRNKKVYLLDRHLKRFLTNAEKLSLKLPVPYEELTEIIKRIVDAFGEGEFFLYVQLSRYSKARSHIFDESDKGNLLITANPINIKDAGNRISLITAEDIRYLMCNIKTLNLLPSVLASQEAKRKGADEAVLIRNGIVTECAHSNVFIVKNGILITHPTDRYILPGISRGRLIELASKFKIPLEERRFSSDELFSADEVIITSTSKLAKVAISLNGIPIFVKENGIADTLCLAMKNDYISSTV